jgi:hypothetical protein
MGGLGAIETGLTLYYHFCEKCLYHVMLSPLYVYTFMSDVFGGWVDL